ncbi:MAG: VWA domain-containing protein [Hyphomicrobiales bacterium]|nr:VWA domain-containing protein [Hyphomicrobiales bacterium]MCP5001440.1 VWA domain-containing protein [Hyphomicrobiales bacterium]
MAASIGNARLSVAISSHCQPDNTGARQPADGNRYFIVEGRVSNRSETSAITLPPLADLLVLQFNAGQAASPDPAFEDRPGSEFSRRPLQPLDDRAFTAVFEVPAGEIVRPVLIVPTAEGVLAVSLDADADTPSVNSAVPVDDNGLSIGVIDVEQADWIGNQTAPDGQKYLIATLQLQMNQPKRLDTGIVNFISLEAAGGAPLAPLPAPAADNDWFGATQTVFPGVPVTGRVLFQVPENSEYAILYDGGLGQIELARSGASPNEIELNSPAPPPAPTASAHADDLTVPLEYSVNPDGSEINVAHQDFLSWQIGGKPALTDGTIEMTGKIPHGYEYWRSGHNITIGFARPYRIHRLALALPNDTETVHGYRVESSLDGETWQTLVDRTDGGHHGTQNIEFEPVRSRMIRISDLFATGEFFYLSEVRAYTRDPVPKLVNEPSGLEFGGVVVQTPSGPNDKERSKLIDGNPEAYWFAHGVTDPDFTFQFHEARQANINALVLHTEHYFDSPAREFRPKRVQIWTSVTSPYAGYSLLADVDLSPGSLVHHIPLPPTDAKFVRLKVLENFGEATTTIGSVGIYETPGDRSIFDDFLIRATGDKDVLDTWVDLPALNADRDIAAFARGGRVISASNGPAPNDVGKVLNDEKTIPAAYFGQSPSEITFRFFRERAPMVSQVNILNRAFTAPGGPKEIILESAMDINGPFEQIGPTYVLTNKLYRWFVIKFAPKRLRYLRVRILSRHPGHAGAIGEIQIIEPRGPGEPSILELETPEELFAGSRNIAHELLGGKVGASVPDGREDWPLTNLTDGLSSDRSGLITPSFGWTSMPGVEKPVDLVFSFADERTATIAGLSVDPYVRIDRPGGAAGLGFYGSVKYWPSEYEVFVSKQSINGPWEKIGRTEEILQRRGKQVIRFAEPVEAKHLALRLLDNFDKADQNRIQLGEVEIYEAPVTCSRSVVSGLPVNLVSPEFGGSIVRFPSQTGKFRATALIDSGFADTKFGNGIWYSGDQTKLPASVTFAFHKTQAAKFDQISLQIDLQNDAAFRPKRVRIEASTGPDPLRGYKEIGVFNLDRDTAEHTIKFGQHVLARYVRMTVLETFGAPGVVIAEVSIPETTDCIGYESVSVIGRADPVPETFERQEAAQVAGGLKESEPNDRPESANPLSIDQTIAGAISPDSDVDYYEVDYGTATRPRIRVRVRGDPSFRADIAVENLSGESHGTFHPGSNVADTVLRWDLPPDRYRLRLSRPKTSVVLLFDTSGSMYGQIDALKEAASIYVRDRADHEEIALVTFDSGVRTIHDFSTDTANLEKALAAELKANGNTALYDGILHSLDLLKERRGQKAIVLLSDGANTSSQASLPDAWERIADDGVRLFTIALGQDLTVYSHRTENYSGIGATPKQLLEHWARATDGAHYFAPGAEDLAGVYRQASLILRSEPQYQLTPLLPVPDGFLQVASEDADGKPAIGAANIVLILDASGSMRGKNAEGIQKMKVAKDVMRSLVSELPESAKVGLRVYGHRLPQKPKSASCMDTELVVPLSPLDRVELIDQVNRLKPKGYTPLGYSIFNLLVDFAPVDGRKMAVLITDGKETCFEKPELHFHPVTAVRELQSVGVDFLLNIVGFDIAEDQTQKMLAEVAGLTGGQYFSASTTEELINSIRQSLALEYVVRNSAGDIVSEGQVGGNPVALPEGAYVVEARNQPDRQLGKAIVKSGETTRIVITN